MSLETVFLLLAGGQGIVLSVGLMASSLRGNRGGVFLGLVLFVLSLVLLNAWGMQSGVHRSMPPFWLVESFLIIPAALWCFIQSVTRPGFRFRPVYGWLFAPAAIEIVTESAFYLRGKLTGQVVRLLDKPFWLFFTEILPVLAMGGVMVFFGLRAWQLRKSAGLPASLTALFGVLSGLTLLWIGEVLLQLPLFGYTESLLIGGFVLLCFIACFRTTFFTAPVLSPEKKERTADDDKEWQRLNRLFEAGQAHTVARITVESVAAELGLPPRYVSALVNRYHGANFSHFVNSYRVKTVVERMRDPKERHKTLLGIALESGFSSKSSFNDSFKQHTGETPSQYFRRVQTGPES